MTTRLVLFSLLLLGFGQQSGFAQTLFHYTNLTDGSGTTAANVAPASLSRGAAIAQASDCLGNQGYGSHGWPTTNVFNVTNFNSAGQYVEFTLDPDAGFGLKVTGFTARLRRENLPGTADDGPIAVRYGYSTDGANWTTVNPGNPLSSNVCTSGGTTRPWAAWNDTLTNNPITFRIYGLSSGANLTGDLFLREIIVNGEVCANAPSITPAPADFLVCAGETSFEFAFSGSTATHYTIDYDAAAEAEGFIDAVGSAIAPGMIIWSIPGNADPGTYNATVTVENECGFETDYPVEITVSALPNVNAILSATAICVGGNLSITFDDVANTGHTFLITANLVDDNGTTPITIPGAFDGAVLNLTEGVHFDGAMGGMVSVTDIVVEDETTGCVSEPADRVITIIPLPNVSITLDDLAICDDGEVTLTFTDNAATGHLFSITADLVDDNGTAVGEINYTNIPSGASDTYVEGIDFEGSTGGTVSLTNIVVTDETTDCENTTLQDLTITVNPYPVASLAFVPAGPVCPGSEVELLFDETAYADTTEFTVGFDASPLLFSLDTLTFTELVDGEDIDLVEGTDFTGNLSLTQIWVTEPVSGCSSAAANVSLTVLPAPAFGFSASSESTPIPQTGNNGNGPNTLDVDFCAGDHLTLSGYTDNGNVGYTVNYTTTGNVTFDGSALPGISTGNNVPANDAATFFGSVYGGMQGYGLNAGTSGTVNQMFIPYLDNDNSGTLTPGDCAGDTMFLNYHIQAIPTVVVSPASTNACHGGTVSVLFSGNYAPGDAIYTWSGGNTAVGMLANGVGDISFVATNTTNAPITVNLTVTPSTDDCDGLPVNFTITVYPNPSVSVTATVGGGDPQPVSNLGLNNSIDLEFCAGESFAYTLYTATPGIGFIEEIVAGSTNLLYGVTPIPAPRAPENIPPAGAAAFFSTTYGPYNLATGETYGWLTETFTPYVDVNNDGDYDALTDCLGAPFTLNYEVYAPISVTVTRNNPSEICSGDPVDYTITTTSTQPVSFDLVLEENTNGGNPADLNDDNILPDTVFGVTINNLNGYNFIQTIDNAVGTFDRGRVRVRTINIAYIDSDVCTTADVNGTNTQVYPKPKLQAIDPLLSCDAAVLELDVDTLGHSINPNAAGFPVRIDWTLNAPGIDEDGATGTIVIFDNDGIALNGSADIAQLLTLTDPLAGPQTATFTITPRASGPSNGFNGDDCGGDPIMVVVTVVPATTPTISGATCVHVGAEIRLTADNGVQLPAEFVSGVWSSTPNVSLIDTFLQDTVLVTGLVAGGTATISYTVTDDAGCVSTAEYDVEVLDELVLSSSYTGGPVSCGEEFTVSVSATGFCDISGLDYFISWDETEFQLVTFTTPALVPGGTFEVNLNPMDPGELFFSFFDDFTPPFGNSLPDNTVVLTYTLRAIGGSGTYNIPDVILNETASNGNFSPVPMSSTGVSIPVEAISLDLGTNPVICPSDDVIHLTFSNVQGNPDYYVIDFDPTSTPPFPDVQQGPLFVVDGEIEIPVPAGLLSGSYEATLVVSDTEYGCESQTYLFSIIVDQVDPTASNPDPVNVVCVSDIPAPNTSVVDDEADNCPGTLVVAYEPTLSSQTGTGCAGNPLVITRVYSVTDAAGNTTLVTQTLTAEDDIAPTVSTTGLNAWYPTEAAAVAAAIARANETKDDNCTPPVGINVVLSSVTYSGFGNCTATIVLAVTDACGNLTPFANATYTTIIDEDAPTVTAGVIDECYDEDDTPTAPYFEYGFAVAAAINATTATDDCDNNLSITATTTGTDCALVITVTATDDCGKSSSVVYNTRVDSEGPNFVPAMSIVALKMEGLCFDTEAEALQAAIDTTYKYVLDDCGPVDDLQFDASSDGGCPAEISVLITDFCGNPTTITYTGVHIDTEDPQVDPDAIHPTCFKSFYGPLGAYAVLADAANPTDNCTSPAELLATVQHDSVQVGLLPNCKEYGITFTFTDNCGNQTQHIFESIIIDSLAPTANPMADLEYTCLDDVEAPDTDLVLGEDDNCGVEDIVWVEDDLPTTCPGTGTRTYRVTDCAGNSYDVVQTIRINDDVLPTWVTTPNFLNRIIDCDDTSSIANALTLSPVAEDNCGEVTVTLASTTSINSCAGGYVRTWTAVDDCGNVVAAPFTQTINIIDEVDPTWVTQPEDLDSNVECGEADALADALEAQPEADDNCSNVTYQMVSRDYEEYEECVDGLVGYYETQWTATDACGNVSVPYYHYVYVYDETAPTWVTPDTTAYPVGLNLTIACTDLAGYAFANSLTPVASDLCDATPELTKTTGAFVPGGSCLGEGSFTNTWTATDACGNVSTVYTQVITVVDNTPPAFDPTCQFMPLNLFTSEGALCGEGISLVVGDSLDYLDSWTVAGVTIPGLGGCIGDDCSPIGSVVVEVVSIVDEYVNGVEINQENSADCVRQITVSFELSDACGNVQPELFVCIYNIIDDTEPEIFCDVPEGGNPTLEDCYPTVLAAEAAALELIDACDNCTEEEDLVVSVNTVGTCDAEVTVTVADCAGNESFYTFHTRIDNAAPEMTAGVIPTCYPTESAALGAALAATIIEDECDSLNVIVTSAITGTCPATVTITATDQCGNSRSIAYPGLCIGAGSEVVINPEASNLNVDCNGWQADLSAWLANHGGAAASGSGIVWTYSPANPQTALETSMPNCSTHTKSVVVTFRATNGCGNFDETTATFSVTDNTPPTANAIANTNLTCSTAIPTPNVELVVNEADNCGGTPTVAVFGTSDNMAPGCPGNPRIVIHQYVVTDGYCNTALINHTITIVDNVPPTFTAPANITINVNASCVYDASTTVAGDVTNESDNCTASGPSLQAFYTDVVNPGVNFQEKFIITRTWQLTDLCGNPAISRMQTITVLDVTAPTITNCPSNLTLPGSIIEMACGAYFGGQTNPLIDDNCSGETISYELSGATQGTGTGFVPGTTVLLEGVTTVTYTVEDAVGNTATCSFTITVNCLTISGRLIWEHNDVSGVQNGTVNVMHVTPTPAFSGSDLSDANGNYDVSVPVNGTYRVRPVKNLNRLNGVDATDATAIKNHVNFSVPITDPYKKVCADVNRSGIINVQDANLITGCLAGDPTSLAIFNVFWRFTPTDFVMPGTAHQNVPVFPEFKDVTLAGMDAVGINFFGMKIGDVNGTSNPLNIANPSALVWMLKDQTLVAGTELEVEFAASNFNDLTGYQFALDFDPSQLQFVGFQPLGAISMTLPNNFGAYNADMGELRNVWAEATATTLAEGTPVFRAKFKVLASGQKLSEVLRLDDSQIACQAFNAAQVPAEVKLVFTESVATETPLNVGALELQLMQNRPNPFSEGTTIGFILPEACEAHIRILDISGRELTSYDRKYTAGYHELDFRMENAASYGVLFCELVTPQGKRTIKMITAK